MDGWMDTLPSFRADAGEALVVLRLLTYSTVLTGSGAAGRQQDLTVFTWWQRKENISVCIALVNGGTASDFNIKRHVTKLILTVPMVTDPCKRYHFEE